MTTDRIATDGRTFRTPSRTKALAVSGRTRSTTKVGSTMLVRLFALFSALGLLADRRTCQRR